MLQIGRPGNMIVRVVVVVRGCSGPVLRLAMIVPVAIDIISQAMRGDIVPAAVVGGYILVGAALYAFWGRFNALAVRTGRASHPISGG